jgi:NADH-quinone oxidoreductase subunit E
MLGMARIRALEVATFYFMFQLAPVGSVAHIQICGTTPCMLRGSDDLVEVCKRKIAKRPHELSEDGMLSWEEVECLGACSNAPMAQIGKDYYEDLTAEGFEAMLDRFRAGEVPVPGSQAGRYASEPEGGVTSLTEHAEKRDHEANASVTLATTIGDTIKRIDGTEVPLRTPWQGPAQADPDPVAASRDPLMQPDGPDGRQGGRVAGDAEPERTRGDSSDGYANVRGSDAEAKGWPEEGSVVDDPEGYPGEGMDQQDTLVTGNMDDDGGPEGSRTAAETLATPHAPVKPPSLGAPRAGGGDDLTRIDGIGPKLAEALNGMGYHHFDQVAAWTAAEVAWMDANLEGVEGRVTRDEWVKQAKVLSEGGGG